MGAGDPNSGDACVTGALTQALLHVSIHSLCYRNVYILLSQAAVDAFGAGLAPSVSVCSRNAQKKAFNVGFTMITTVQSNHGPVLI